MTYPSYNRNQLEAKSLSELKEIALQLGAVALDKRIKLSWVEAILDKMPSPAPQPVEVEQDDYLFQEQVPQAVIAYDGDSFEGLTLPYVVKINGIVIFRDSTYARCERHCQWQGYEILDYQQLAQCEFEQHIEEQAEAIAPEVPEPISTAPKAERGSGRIETGDSVLHLIASGRWVVINKGVSIGEIYQDNGWSNNLGLSAFISPYEAVADLVESAYSMELVQ